MHVDKPSARFPCAQRDSTLRGVGSLLNEKELIWRGNGGRGVGLAFGEMFNPLISPRFPIGHFACEPNHLHRHHPLRRLRLPRPGRPNHERRAPKLRGQLSAQLPPKQANDEPGQPNCPGGASCARLGALISMRLSRRLTHGVQVRAQTTTTDLSGLHPHGGAERVQLETCRAANSPRPGRRGGGS